MSTEVPKLGRELSLEVAVQKFEVVDSAESATGLAAGIEALKARVSLAKSGQHVEYVLQVRMNGTTTWSMRRRFQQMSLMHESIKRRLPSLPELPAKSVVRQFSPEYLESRKNAIAVYLRELAKRRDVLNCIEAQEFFGMHEHDASLARRSELEPLHAAEVQESLFGITSFIFDGSRGLLLLGAADCNWASRMDTKITNIKLPWEPSAPDLPSSQMTLWKVSESQLDAFAIQFSVRFGPSISCVAMTGGEEGLCLCGLSDGSVGFQKLSAPRGASRGATLPLLTHTAQVSAIAVDDEDQWLFTASKDNALKVYDLSKQFMLGETCAPSSATAMLYEKARRRLFTGLQVGTVAVWDTTSLPLKLLCTIPDSSQALTRLHGLDYDPSSGTLFAASKDALRVWCVKSAITGSWGRAIGTLPVLNQCTAVAWVSSSREMVAGFVTGACVAFALDGESGPSFAWQAHEDEVTMMHWDEAHRRLFTSSKDKKLRIWHFPSLTRDWNPFATTVVSSAPQHNTPGASQVKRSSVSSRPTETGYNSAAPAAVHQRGPAPPANDSDDDLTGWDR